MAKWNFFVTGGSLIKELDSSGNDVKTELSDSQFDKLVSKINATANPG